MGERRITIKCPKCGGARMLMISRVKALDYEDGNNGIADNGLYMEPVGFKCADCGEEIKPEEVL